MMRPPALFFSPVLIILLLASEAAASDAAVGRLESVSVLRAGAGSSLAARTSSISSLVAATSVDRRSVVIELVGITAQRRSVAFTDTTGMISQVTIDTTGASSSSAVTRIRVSLARPYRHRVRISGRMVYVDFERVDEPDSTLVARRGPVAPKVKPAAAAAPSMVRAGALPPLEPPKVAITAGDLLSRWLAIKEHLEHTSNTTSSRAALARPWMPLVLKDGATLFSYGDYAEVDGQIAFLLPFEDADTPRVEAVVVGTSSIDRDATTRATDSVRAARYTITRAPADFANLTDEVSAILNAVPSQADPVARVKMVEGARQRLVEWPAQHYDYRARDISDAVGLLDPILNELRAAAGVPRVDVTLSAGVAKAPRTIAVQPPTLVDLLENAMRVVALITPSQRTSVLRATTESLRRHRPMLPAVWFRTVERRVAATLRNETRLDVAYDKLSRDILSRAMRAASAADVRAISSLQAELTEADRKLGGQREDIVYSTMTGLQDQFNIAAAARLRLDREAMELSPR